MKKKITTGDIVEIIGDELTPIGWNEEHAKRIDGIPELAQRIVKLFAIPDVSGSLPDKDILVSELYSRVYNAEYKQRHVMKSTLQDCYYSGYLDCYDELAGNKP